MLKISYINAEWDFVKTIFREMLLFEKWTWTELGFEAKSSSSQLRRKCELVLVQVHWIWVSSWTCVHSFRSFNALSTCNNVNLLPTKINVLHARLTTFASYKSRDVAQPMMRKAKHTILWCRLDHAQHIGWNFQCTYCMNCASII